MMPVNRKQDKSVFDLNINKDVHTCSEYAISPLTEQCVTAEVHSAKFTTVICDDKRPGLVFILQRSWEAGADDDTHNAHWHRKRGGKRRERRDVALGQEGERLGVSNSNSVETQGRDKDDVMPDSSPVPFEAPSGSKAEQHGSAA
ncbi:hypothetical protein JOQ06_003536 [Pogonophryne albipinna]|uniref:Uncharacterized protein n=1 Tax=Pogonophryne albipinna TaxID=1090488 RepID=A0AAD6F8F6_9TELE|nr:hypothetical protein JOQ06_003536 [Pogonophryne albipinna]